MSSTTPTDDPRVEAVLECVRSAFALIPENLRRGFVLVGAVATIAHGLERRTEDADFAVTPEAGWAFQEAARQHRGGFSISGGHEIVYVASQGFNVGVELLELGGPFVRRIDALEPFYDGFVASVADLARLRATTCMGRGEDKDFEDLSRLLELMTSSGAQFGHLDEDEMRDLFIAAEELSSDKRYKLYPLLTTWTINNTKGGRG